MEIRPQSGPQEEFLKSSADIAIYGGQAGGGKTYALILEPLRHVNVSDFTSVTFRRTVPQIIASGGLWDTTGEIYPKLGATGIQQPYRWTFPSGMRSEYHHLVLERNVYDWQGAQVPLLCWDELTHFTKRQFFYMMSRNRSLCGVKPYIRGTCNPDPDSWVKDFISWWLDADQQYADLSKSGTLRWMVRRDDDLLWFDTKKEAQDCMKEMGLDADPKSVTFIPASIYDNKILMERDPSYLATLMALPRVERQRLLGGDWKVRAVAGSIFSRDDFEIVDAVPVADRSVRFWDRAATEVNPTNTDPDWTAGVKMQRSGNMFFITDVKRMRVKSGQVETTIKNAASTDAKACIVGMYVDPGQAGKAEINNYYKMLAGWPLVTLREVGKKYLRWQPLAAQAQHGNVKLLRGKWNEEFLTELENLAEDGKGHDDQGDAAAGAFEVLTTYTSWRPA